MPEIRFDTPYTPPADPKAKPVDDTNALSDYPKVFVSGGAKQLSNAMQFLEGEDAPEGAKRVRRAIGGFGDSVAETLSPNAKANMQREILDFSDKGMLANPRSIPLQLVGSVGPSLVATAGVGTVAAMTGRAAGALFGAAAGGTRVGGTAGVLGAGYGMGGGEVTGNVQEVVNKATPQQLGEGDPNSLWTKYRAKYSEVDTREKIGADLRDGFAQGYGVFSAVLNSVGPMGTILRKAVTGQSIKGAVKGGVRRAIGVGGLNEATDEAAGDIASQVALERGLGIPYNPAQTAESAAKGGVFGGITGGAGRIIAGKERVTDNRGQEVSDEQQDALNNRRPPPPPGGGDRSTGAAADSVMENARALVAAEKRAQEEELAQREEAPVNPEVNPPPAPPATRSAIPEFDPMQNRREMMRTGAQDEAPSTPPLPTLDPYADRRDAMRPGEVQTARPPRQAQMPGVDRLQYFADANNGVIDPVQIAASLSNAYGTRVDPREVLNNIAPYVEAGVLRQSMRSGYRGTPTFSMATERQGPSAPQQGPQQPVGPQQPYGPYAPRGNYPQNDRAQRPLGNLSEAQRAPLQEGPGLFDQGDLFGAQADQRQAPNVPPQNRPAGQAELPLEQPQRQLGLPLRPGRLQVAQRRTAAAAKPTGGAVKGLTAKKSRAAKPAPAPKGMRVASIAGRDPGKVAQAQAELDALLNPAKPPAKKAKAQALKAKAAATAAAATPAAKPAAATPAAKPVAAKPAAAIPAAKPAATPTVVTPSAAKPAAATPATKPAEASTSVPRAGSRNATPTVVTPKQAPKASQVFRSTNPDWIQFGSVAFEVGDGQSLSFGPNGVGGDKNFLFYPNAKRLSGRRGEGHVSQLDEKGVPKLLQPIFRDYISGKIAYKDFDTLIARFREVEQRVNNASNNNEGPPTTPPTSPASPGGGGKGTGAKGEALKQKAKAASGGPSASAEPPPRTPAGVPAPKEAPLRERQAAPPRERMEEPITPVTAKPTPAPAKVPVKMSPEQAKDRALAAVRKGPDGKPDIGVISGIMRMVYNRGMPANGQQSVSFGTDWYDELTAKDRRDVVAILEGWRQTYGAELDVKRPLKPWMQSEKGMLAKAKTDLDALAAKFKVTRGGKQVVSPTRAGAEAAAQQDYLVSDRALVDVIKSEFKGIVEKGDGDLDALVASIMKQAKTEMEDGGLQALDYPQLLDTAKQNLSNIPTASKPGMIAKLKQALQDVENASERGNQIERAIAAQVETEGPSPVFFASQAEDRETARMQGEDIAVKREDLIARYKELPAGPSRRRAALDREIMDFHEEMGWSPEFNELWQKVKAKVATEQETQKFFRLAQGDRTITRSGPSGAATGSPELILPEQLKVEAEQVEAKLEANKLGADAVGGAGKKNVRATKSRLLFYNFINEDTGELRDRETIKANANKIAAFYNAIGEPLPDAISVLQELGNFSRRGRMSAENQNTYDNLLKRGKQAAENWDADATERLFAEREALLKTTAQGVFGDFAPVPGETLKEASDRLLTMMRTFIERQNSVRNKSGVMNMLRTSNDPYMRFVSKLMTLTEGGTKPLTFQDPSSARAEAERGDLTEKQLTEFEKRVARGKARRSGAPVDRLGKAKILSRLRNSKNPRYSRTAMRDTQAWRDIRANLGDTESAYLNPEADKIYRALQPQFKDTVLGARGLNRAVEARVRRAQDELSLLATEFSLRIGNDVGATDALGAVLEDLNPFAVHSDPSSFSDISRVSELDLGNYSASEALDGAFPYGATNQGIYGPFAQLNSGLLSTLAQNNVKVNVLAEGDYYARPTQPGSVGHYDPNDNTVYLLGGRNIVAAAITLQHELVHAATYWGIRTPELAAKAQDVLKEAQGNAQLQALVGDYALSSIDEMLAYGFSSPEAAAALASVQLSDKTAQLLGLQPKSTFWTWLVDTVRSIAKWPKINRNQTMLQGIILLGNQAAAEQNNGGRPRSGRDFALVYDQGITDRLKTGLARQQMNVGPKGTKILLALSTMTDMVQTYGKLFTWNGNGVRQYLQLARQRSPLEQFENAAAYKDAQRQQLEQELKPFLERISNLGRTNPKMAAKLDQLTLAASQANMDPSQATPPGRFANGQDATSILNRQIHAELHSQYLQLSDEAQDIVKDISRVVADLKEAMIRGMTRTVLLSRWQEAQRDRKVATDALPEGFPEKPDTPIVNAAIERILDKKQTAEDISWLGTSGHDMLTHFVKDIGRGGFYVPAYRSGDWVVFGKRTDFDAKGEFATQGEALAEANRIRASGGFVKRIYIRTFDPAGQRISYADRKSRTDLTEKFVVEAETHVYEAFETRYDAEQRRNEMLKEGNADLRPVEPRESSQENYLVALDNQQNAMLTNAVRSITTDDKDPRRQELLTAFRDVSARLMPGATLRHSMIKRRNVIGAQSDLFRTMSKFVDASARYSSGMEYAPYMESALLAMDDARRVSNDTKNPQRLYVISELKGRTGPGKVEGTNAARNLQRLSSLWFLSSPSYGLIQLLQPAMMGTPVLAKLNLKSSLTEIASEMKQAHDDVGGFGQVAGSGIKGVKRILAKWRSQATEGPVNLLEAVKRQVKESGAKDAEALNNLLDELARRGRVDEHAGMEVARDIKAEGGMFARNFRMLEDFSRAFPTAAETYNRSVMAIAAYRLAIKNGDNVEAAFFKAEQAIIDSQFVYNPHNAPSFFTKLQSAPYGGGVLAASFLTFKKFTQAMYMQMGRSLYDSVKGETPAIRKAAFRQFSIMMATHAAMAGVLGLPLEPLKFALGAVALLFGEDEPWDIDKAILKAVNEQFGKEAGEIVTRGLPRLINLDLSGRLSLEGLLFFKELKDFKKETLLTYGAELLLGPQGSIGSGALDAAKTLRDGGSPWRALEQATPKVVRDTLAARRLAEEGQTDLKGNRVDEGLINKGDAIWKAIGFSSGTAANIAAERSAGYKEAARVKVERARLHRRMALATEAGPEAVAAVQAKIDAFNAENPDNEVTEKSIKQAAAQRARSTDPERTYFGRPVKKGTTGTSMYNLPDKDFTGQTTPSPAARPAPLVVAPGSASGGEHPFFAALIKAEGTDRRGDPYNEVLGYGRYGMPPQPLTEMTLAEVYDFGRTVRARHGSSSAVGAFQIVGATMKAYMAAAGLDWNDLFDETNQRKLAYAIAQGQGVRPSTWEGLRGNPRLLAAARTNFENMTEEDVA
ncbi:hypothetical protein UFOVP470_27 [uncultured Caudovirales phage]|uniref:Uncharacterized protein n=1 Tax=uncultured Caudovirales phage TaxID=2100421 RepID=A0A6J5MCJ1_9CAUD|nr:hypothetical protein UFOVP470_27 [uncultured Caudovirales phage]